MAIDMPYSVSSDDSEGTILREFMDAQAQAQIQHDAPHEATFRHFEEPPVNMEAPPDRISYPRHSDRGQQEPDQTSFAEHTTVQPLPMPTPVVGISPAPIRPGPELDTQHHDGESRRRSQDSRATHDSKRSNRRSHRSHRSSKEPSFRIKHASNPTTMTMSEMHMHGHHHSPHAGDLQGHIPQDFDDAHEGKGVDLSPHRVSPNSRAAAEAGPSKRRSRRTSGSYRERAFSDTSLRELVRHLSDSRKETNTLHRALRLAVDRVEAETRRVKELEGHGQKTIEYFTTLNENRIAEQQEAQRASTELRLYQFKLDRAQKEMTRAQEMLRTVERERDDAEEAAARAREKARVQQQERMIFAAKEEGRRLGFQDGLRRAQEEAELLYSGARDSSGARVRIERETQPIESLAELLSDQIADIDLDAISSPVHHHHKSYARRHNLGEEPPTPPFQPHVQPPTPPETEAYAEEESQPATESVAAAYAQPPISRVASPGPSVLRYAVSIPPASALERQHEHNEYLGKSSQPWVTAQEYHQLELSGRQPTPEDIAAFIDRKKVIFAPPSNQGNPGKRKESWLRRTLSRPWRKPSKPTQSWYHPSKPEPAVHVRDFGALEPRNSIDTSTASTHVSQFDIISPPPKAPSSTASVSEKSYRGRGGRTRFKEMDPTLYVINEDSPASRVATPLKKDISHKSPTMEEVKSLIGDNKSNYSDPKAVEEWRRSNSSMVPSVPKETIQETPVRPPSTVSSISGPRLGPPRHRHRPTHLTVPSPLAPLPPPSFNPQQRSFSEQTQNPAFLGVNDRPELSHQPTSATIYGITVEPPSRSPTEAPNSGRPPTGDFLSPNHSYTPSLRSSQLMATSLKPPSINEFQPIAPLTPRRSRPGSVVSQPPLPTMSPMMAGSRSLPVDPSSLQQSLHDRPRRSSIASNATPNAPTRPMADNASVRSANHSVRQSISPSLAPEINKYSAGSHRRTASDSTYLMPNDGTSMVNRPSNGGQGQGNHSLHRIPSNQSMNSLHSNNSQYSRFDPTTYVDPTALYEPISVTPKGRSRAYSNGSTLSYVSRS